MIAVGCRSTRQGRYVFARRSGVAPEVWALPVSLRSVAETPSEVFAHEFSDLSSETENPVGSYLQRSMSKQRAAMLPSKAQQHAIEAKLNFALGAETYDRLFLGFICGGVENDMVVVFVQNEDTAAIVGTEYSWHVAVAVESVLKKPVKRVNVLPISA